MNITRTTLPGVLVLEPKVFGDSRGFFVESWNGPAFDEAVGTLVRFVQDNQSRSRRGVLRGLHLQTGASAQGKLVRVARGRVFDVAADVRRASPTFGHWIGLELDDQRHRQLWIPPGYAHGFLVLSDEADFIYKTTAHYAPEHEVAVRWNDPRLSIDWPDTGAAPLLAPRDRDSPLLDEREAIG